MWKSSGTTIEMTVGDYGIGLPIKISGVEFGKRGCYEDVADIYNNSIIT